MVDASDQARIPAIANYRAMLITPTAISHKGGTFLFLRTYQQWAVVNLRTRVSAKAKRLPIKRKQALIPHNGSSKACLQV
ncbi:hypothetical protein HMPREF0654_10635 [Prevotella disiens DNF00882]|uniref:Uncharacterized protein n=1 Tax=Prevotella disiens DNF00882 TaxID=1401075 RepID=A0A096AK06_9BACT|nr:hypothetical protein HMPREF0654_10635 [Prevotella disiens DNF00882]